MVMFSLCAIGLHKIARQRARFSADREIRESPALAVIPAFSELHPLNALVEDQTRRLRQALDSDETLAWMDANRAGNRAAFGRRARATTRYACGSDAFRSRSRRREFVP